MQQSGANSHLFYATLARAYLAALLRAEKHKAAELVFSALGQGADLYNIYILVFRATLHELGLLWQQNTVSFTMVQFCSMTTQYIMSELYPQTFNTLRNGHRLVAATVPGDRHTIGIHFLADILQYRGWDTMLLSGYSSSSDICSTVVGHGAGVVALSVSTTAHFRSAVEVIKRIRASAQHTTIMMGGALLSHRTHFFQSLGADEYAGSLTQAISIAERLAVTSR